MDINFHQVLDSTFIIPKFKILTFKIPLAIFIVSYIFLKNN